MTVSGLRFCGFQQKTAILAWTKGCKMRDKFYSDNRDLVKWAVLHRLAEIYNARRILQIAFYRPSEFPKVTVDGKEHKIPQQVISHFRDLQKIENINSEIQVDVFADLFDDRTDYLQSVKKFLSKFQAERCVVFLDPDTGLAPQNPNFDHVLESEAKTIWKATKSGDVYVFYQHQTNMAGQPWMEPKRSQLENALDLNEGSIKVACGLKIARDVVFFYAPKP
ncbi:MAG: hypothetical protein ACLPYB_01190 [Desulfobaccales bacterium]